jgi:hypothetical protein
MSGVVRIGDAVSCGDFAATGSANVFVNGLPVVNEGAKITTGHGCFPPTVFISGWSTTVFVNNNPIGLQNKTKIDIHRCKKDKHDGVVVGGSADTFCES